MAGSNLHMQIMLLIILAPTERERERKRAEHRPKRVEKRHAALLVVTGAMVNELKAFACACFDLIEGGYMCAVEGGREGDMGGGRKSRKKKMVVKWIW